MLREYAKHRVGADGTKPSRVMRSVDDLVVSRLSAFGLDRPASYRVEFDV
jgi:hypothetical protein